MKQLISFRRQGFTLVELMVSTAILTVLLVVLVTITGQTSNTWRYTNSKIEQFRDARVAFETMSRRIGQATLNTYWDYQYSGTIPSSYIRQSDLRFVCGNMQTSTSAPALMPGTTPLRPTHGIFFQAPLGYVAPANATDTTYNDLRGMENLLNTWGYYVEVNTDDKSGQRPSIFSSSSFPPLRARSRLMELMQPANVPSTTPTVYTYTLPAVVNPSTPVPYTWFTAAIDPTAAGVAGSGTNNYHVLAENVIALIILPKLSKQDAANLSVTNPDTALAPYYAYDSGTVGQGTSTNTMLNSKNQLPPTVQLTMVAIDETSALRAMPDLNTATNLVRTLTGVGSAFTNANSYATDLLYNPPPPASAQNQTSLEYQLISKGISYRIFTTNVSIRSAKWSQAQGN